MYVLQVKTGTETDTRDALARHGIRALVPQERRLIRSGGKWIHKVYTLLPGYVIVDAGYTAETYYAAKGIPGVVRWLADDTGEPVALTLAEQAWIRILNNNGQPIDPSKLTQGTDGKWHAAGGVLSYLEHTIVKVDRHRRKAICRLALCGQPREVTLSVLLD